MTKIIIIIIAVILGVFALYAAIALVWAGLPQTLRPEEVESPRITVNETGQRQLNMEVYTGHSALNPEGVKLKTKDDMIIVRPVYCLIDAPINLCRPDVVTKLGAVIHGTSFMHATVELPTEPSRVVLEFRDGSSLDVK